jgi:hypothetical protein
MSDYHPDDPNKGIPIKELLKTKKFVEVEKQDWFDPTAKPKNSKVSPAIDPNFEPDQKEE